MRLRYGHCISYMQPTIVHIGPPKTASTSIQQVLIPKLGLPHQIKPVWCRSLARGEQFTTPIIQPGSIISDETLGEFLNLPPEAIAPLLFSVVLGAKVVFVRRDPRELFFSLYLQRLLNMAMALKDHPELKPKTADKFFDICLEQYQRTGTGFLAMISNDKIFEAFGKFFQVEAVSYDLLKTNPKEFVRVFSKACGNELTSELPHLNEGTLASIESILTGNPRRQEFIDCYNSTLTRSWHVS